MVRESIFFPDVDSHSIVSLCKSRSFCTCVGDPKHCVLVISSKDGSSFHRLPCLEEDTSSKAEVKRDLFCSKTKDTSPNRQAQTPLYHVGLSTKYGKLHYEHIKILH